MSATAPIPAGYGAALDKKWDMLSAVATGRFASGSDDVVDFADYLGVPRRADDIRRFVCDQLQEASPFFWGAEMCDMLMAVAPGIPDFTFTAEAAPTPHGFMYFEKPLKMPQVEGLNSAPLGALGWSRGHVTPRADLGSNRIAIRLSDYDDRHADRWSDALIFSVWFATGGALRFGALNPIRLGESLTTIFDRARARYQDDDTSWVVGHAGCKYLGALFAFLDQEILTTRPTVAPRATRKRAPSRANPATPINVVLLRRTQRSAPHAEPGEAIDWSCRWIVRGHWRQQYYPSQKVNKPKWIMPYEKGPESKPLRAKPTVFAVVR